MQNRNFEKINHRAVQQKNQRCFELDQSEIFWVQRFLKRGGGAVQLRFHRQPLGIYQADEIADDNHQPEKAGEDAVELEIFPNRIFPLEIKIKRLIIRAVAQVVAHVSLPTQLEGCGEKKCHNRAADVIDPLIGMENIVLRFVAQGVASVHDKSVNHRDQRHGPPALNLTGGPQQGCANQHDQRREAKI